MSDARLAEALWSMQARIDRLERELSGIPSRWAGGADSSLKILQIIGGQTLSTGQAGIKYSSSAIASVPSAYDPEVDTTFIDGIGRAYLYVDGALQATRVLVANYNGNGSPIDFALLGGSGDYAYTATTVAIPISGGGGTTVTCYVPTWL
jgi:hypothetical protein